MLGRAACPRLHPFGVMLGRRTQGWAGSPRGEHDAAAPGRPRAGLGGFALAIRTQDPRGWVPWVGHRKILKGR